MVKWLLAFVAWVVVSGNATALEKDYLKAFDEAEASVFLSIERNHEPFTVVLSVTPVIRHKAENLFDRPQWHLAFYEPTNNNAPIIEFEAHRWSVFRTREGVVYFAEYCPYTARCGIIAFDLKAKKELWRTGTQDYRGIIIHSIYQNRVNMLLEGDQIVIVGKESGCDYVNVLDRKTGKILHVESHVKQVNTISP